MKKYIRLLVRKGSAPAGYEAEYPVETADYLIRQGFAEEVVKAQPEETEKPAPTVKILKGIKND